MRPKSVLLVLVVLGMLITLHPTSANALTLNGFTHLEFTLPQLNITEWGNSKFEIGPTANYKLEGYLTGPIDVFVGTEKEWQLSSLSVLYDQDPSITYGIAVIDFGAPSNFAFSFITPMIPIVGANQVTTSFAYSVTDGQNGLVNIMALPPVGIPVDGDANVEIQVAVVNDGLGWTNLGHDLGPSAGYNTGALGSASSPANNEAGAGPVSMAGWNMLRIDVNFSGSGGGDVYTLNGAATINPIPEPGILMLLGFGLLSLGFAVLRKR
jgi:hypothetical protein